MVEIKLDSREVKAAAEEVRPAVQGVVDNIKRAQEIADAGMARAQKAAQDALNAGKELFAKMGITKPATVEDAAIHGVSPDASSDARANAARLKAERNKTHEGFEQMARTGYSPANGKPQNYWVQTVGKGPAQENVTGAPQGSERLS